MPNRVIKESTFESEKIASLSDFEFRLWVGLITQADDAGRGDARPAIIKGHVFALRERVSTRDIESALRTLAAAGCIDLYRVGGRSYFQFPSWARHQRIRDCKPKYPGPDEADGENANSPQSAATRGNSPQSAATRGLNPIQSESESESNTGSNTRASRSEPPTLAEVEAYVMERGSSVDPKRFWEYYSAGNWKDAKGNPVKNWKQKLITWEKKDETAKQEVKSNAGRFAELDWADGL